MNKCAEYGVDKAVAESLMCKSALNVGGLFGRIGGYARRFGNLLAGGDKNVLKNYNKYRSAARNWIDSGIKHRNQSAIGVGETMLDNLAAARLGMFNGKVRVRMNGQPKSIYDVGKIMNPEVMTELNKVLAARLGTAAAGGAALYGLSRS